MVSSRGIDFDGSGSLRNTVASQSATIQELERRLSKCMADLADRDRQIVELTRIAKEFSVQPASKARGRRSSPSPPQDVEPASADRPERQRESSAQRSSVPREPELEFDEIG